jgi:single-strand selective monofunctional uracil DNA glycosylase
VPSPSPSARAPEHTPPRAARNGVSTSAADDLVAAAKRLRSRVKRLRFWPPVAYVYNPLEYAWPIARSYYERYGCPPKEVLFVGMNPGPFGMAQTGVPFGEIAAVRDYLCLSGEVASPRRTHPKRPVQGLACPRSEVSGQRLWAAFASRHPKADDFFSRAFVVNYCPLMFLSESGANITPDKLPKEDRQKLEAVCDKSLAETFAVLRPRHVVGIGNYAAKRASKVLGTDVIVMPHPSPASPSANRGWEKAARKALVASGLCDLL